MTENLPAVCEIDAGVRAGDALDFVKTCYNNEDLPLELRMKAAGIALPFERPKLSAVAHLGEPRDMGTLIENAHAVRDKMCTQVIVDGKVRLVRRPLLEAQAEDSGRRF
jgi:hypothetical protein